MQGLSLCAAWRETMIGGFLSPVGATPAATDCGAEPSGVPIFRVVPVACWLLAVPAEDAAVILPATCLVSVRGEMDTTCLYFAPGGRCAVQFQILRLRERDCQREIDPRCRRSGSPDP